MLLSVRGIVNITRDAVIKIKGDERSCISLSVCTNERRKDGNKAHFFDADYWVTSDRAENLCQYFTKGVKIEIEGTLCQYSFEKDGQKKTRVYINVRDFAFVERKREGASSEPASPSKPNGNITTEVNEVSATHSIPYPGSEAFDDNIPF